MEKHYVYQFYAELEGFSPKIWRRFKIVGSKTMAELGYSLMVLFEMKASHLFCITIDKQKTFKEFVIDNYTESEADEILKKYDVNDHVSNVKYEIELVDEKHCAPNEEWVDANKVTISRACYNTGSELLFNYDYGDDWNVKLVLEKCEKIEVSLTTLSHVIDGAGFGIVEDVGGVYGLEHFAKVMKKGRGHEFDEFSEWYGSSIFDINHFDKRYNFWGSLH